MKALVINLKTAPERKKFQQYQLEKLGINYKFMDAVSMNSAPVLRSKEYWRTGVRLLKNSEKACFLSHLKCWNKVLQADEPMLILEDDALLSIKTPLLLAKVKNFTEMDVLNLETRGRRILVKKNPELTPDLHQLFLNRDGAAAYILWPSGAKKMIEKTNKIVGIADAILWTNFTLRSYQMNPALALQSDRCPNYGIQTPLETKSSIATDLSHSHKDKSNFFEYLQFRFRRFQEQLRITKPQIFNCFNAEKISLEIEKRDFAYLAEYKN